MPSFEMYTDQADQAVATEVEALLTRVRAGQVRRTELPAEVHRLIGRIDKVHPEVHDTEPEWAIVDAVNVECDAQGWKRMHRDDIWDAAHAGR